MCFHSGHVSLCVRRRRPLDACHDPILHTNERNINSIINFHVRLRPLIPAHSYRDLSPFATNTQSWPSGCCCFLSRALTEKLWGGANIIALSTNINNSFKTVHCAWRWKRSATDNWDRCPRSQIKLMRGSCPCHVPAVRRMWIRFDAISCPVFCYEYRRDVTVGIFLLIP